MPGFALILQISKSSQGPHPACSNTGGSHAVCVEVLTLRAIAAILKFLLVLSAS